MTLTKTPPRRPTSADRKRTGQHHRHSRHYVKTYWPYLPVLAVLLCGVFVNNWLGQAHHNVLGYATNISADVLLTDTNAQRSVQHETPLTLNNQLTAAAQTKANDMAARNYWSHVTPDGKQPWSFIDASGYHYQAAGENLAYGFGTSDQVIEAWMHSSKHRANILNSSYRDVGFATANVANYQGQGPETIVVAMYAEPVAQLAAAPVTPSFPLDNQTQAVSRLQLVTDSTWAPLALVVLCGAAIILFFVRHAFAWHKVLVRGEQFVLHHPFFDLLLMSAVVLAFLLSHAAGTIL